jgi:hypothetical protein
MGQAQSVSDMACHGVARRCFRGAKRRDAGVLQTQSVRLKKRAGRVPRSNLSRNVVDAGGN